MGFSIYIGSNSTILNDADADQHNLEGKLFHVIWLNLYMMFLTVYAIETCYVVYRRMIINHGSILIIISTLICLLLKIITYFWSVVADIYNPDDNLDDILAEVAEFANLFVYICNFFFIFTLWKSYICL